MEGWNLRRVVLSGLVLGLVAVGNAQAENGIGTDAVALSVGVTESDRSLAGEGNVPFLLRGRYFLDETLAVTAGAGFAAKGGDADGFDFAVLGGARQYLDDRGSLLPFAGGFIGYQTTDDGDNTHIQLLGEFGAEYFFSPQFSVEGSARAGYSSVEWQAGGQGGTTKENTFGTHGVNLSVNYYF